MKLNAIELPPRAPGLSRTLILLHGYGADERDLLPIAHALDPRLRAVSLQGSVALGGPMRAWFNLEQDARGRITFDADAARAAVRGATAAVEEIAATSPRPLLLGFSQGAGIAVGVALLRPDLAAGVLSFSGVARALEDQDHAPMEKLRGFPVFAAHGLDDPLLPIELGRDLRATLEALGLDVEWHEYPMEHMVIPEEIEDARRWLNARL
ncbi:MAG: phospholipase [Deltaproteobacteria bacterium]|nr:MAG: phospholipase [Deltaproteobacteria bacterium]TMB42736.1 MAG: phospholipase [Deltaproteobacteria bacterium]